MLDWFYNNETLAFWLLLVSIVSFIGTLVVVPFIITLMPADYFSPTAKHRLTRTRSHFALMLPLWIIKNTLGIFLVLAGILMLALPGQGLLTILVGLIFLDFPGKYRLERKLISIHAMLNAINWIRSKSHKPPLIIPEDRERIKP